MIAELTARQEAALKALFEEADAKRRGDNAAAWFDFLVLQERARSGKPLLVPNREHETTRAAVIAAARARRSDQP